MSKEILLEENDSTGVMLSAELGQISRILNRQIQIILKIIMIYYVLFI